MNNKNQKFKYLIKICLTIVLMVCLVLIILIKGNYLFKSLNEIINQDKLTNKLFNLVYSIILCITLLLIASISIDIGNKSNKQKIKTFGLLIGNIIKYIAVIGTLLNILSICGIDTSALITLSGVLTLIIGLGCQSLVSDIVSGIFLILEGDINVGDVVVINGWRGTIKEIGLRRTKIEDIIGNVNIINNSSITNIINNSKDLSKAVCFVGIEYAEDLKRVEEVFNNNLKTFKDKIPSLLSIPEYKGVAELGSSSVILRIEAWCKEEDKYQTERDINREIKLMFDANHINIPFTQVVLNYREDQNKK